ncbi:transcription-repair coupling factor [Oleiphilus sp. HI0069]|uniref:transcription-repair coupling factor n=7 Tax=unclassified Oleiphilus TaxID=2631174 RepID=UPI0007C388F7|nr:transcription-repair coupling factor [Oleiphilus sp. HI0132]KZY84243.1 transcription-repair coupling factor [Oleiphilus sp. HI0069]KZZ78430.1 transcription-repair coupling factor [Oleiphilus sp. HI0132]
MNVSSISSTLIPSAPADHKHWGSIPQGASAATLYELLNELEGFCLYIAKDSQQAYAMESAFKFFNEGKHEVYVFPDWETLPYDTFSPHEDIISQRLETLSKLPLAKRGLLIIPLNTLLHRLPPKSFLNAHTFSLKNGQTFELEKYRRMLEEVGYRNVNTVYEHGEYAIRGSIFDLYPMGSEEPVRIELFDDEIESLRTFDPDNQRSKNKIKSLKILPANEFPWDDKSRMSFRNRWLEQFPNAASNCPLYRDIKDGIKPHGVEYYSPLFFEEMTTLFDYLPEQSLVITPSDMPELLDHVWSDINGRYEDRRHDIQRPILPPRNLFLTTDELFSDLKQHPRLTLSTARLSEGAGKSNLPFDVLGQVGVDDRNTDPLSALKTAIDAFAGKTLIIAETAGRREVLSELFTQYAFAFEDTQSWQSFLQTDSQVQLVTGSLSHGFISQEASLQVITETELFGQRVVQSRRRKKSSDNSEMMVKNLTELSIGAPVVHIDNGVGRYRGLETIKVGDQVDEFLMLEYANEAKLYVPVSNLNLISRYSGTDESLAPLHRLGTEKWSAAKQKALEKIRDTAAELLEVYAKREARSGFKCDKPGEAYRAFCANFPFEETPDQQAAIKAVLRDMTREQPMDRLVCGDVGFGKTEVAMRAAFVATYSGKQVAVLVPTTLLAQQHYESFQDRFAGTAVKVDVLSRFNSPKDQAKALEDLKAGKIDIIVGTHKLIQKDVKYKDLGLLVIDEEHRFGVQQKEKIKSFRSDVDILNLTATPIPRTLNMAMGGIRDLSIIATPPAKRLSVKTFVREREDALIKESLLREILRGGQVYYLFNDVKNIHKEAEYLTKLVPEARVGIAHGQMRERELETAMSDFYHQRFNVLVCSTIIETGIDIPNANTIMIDRADKFGLAQLHQLRGRVGRSHHQAYAYLMTPSSKKLSGDAEKRLEAIVASQELGAGFMLATHDLEIRGAGELLGEEQSGQIQNIGFTLYMDLLDQAVKSLKQGKELDLENPMHGTEVNLRIPAIIPDEYLPDVHMRLVLYKRIANAADKDGLKDIQVEMIDRFGMLPDAVKNLMRQTELKLKADPVGIDKIDAGETSGSFEFSKDTKVDPLAIVQLVQKNPIKYKLEGATKLKFELEAKNAEEKLSEIEALIALLSKAPT